MTAARAQVRRFSPLALMAASGFASLGYEIVWTEQSALWLGHEAAAVLAVVTAFFGGLALGALVFGSRIENSRHPLRWYLGCELGVGLWSLLLLGVALPVSSWAQRLIGVTPSAAWQWSVAFCGTYLLFLPATAALGATLPAMERLVAQSDAERRAGATPCTAQRSIAALYASNTFGAVLGALGTAFWLIPVFGLTRSSAACIAVNLVCGTVAWLVFPRTANNATRLPPRQRRAFGVLWRLAGTGFLGIGYEVLVVRVLSQITENTVYTFALLLAVYLVGTAAGAAGYRRWLEGRRVENLGEHLLVAVAVACVFCTALLWTAESVKHWALDVFGPGVAAALATEALLALVAFGPPTLLMGALFSQLSRSASAAGVSFGRALGVNMLAAAAAPLLVGVLAIPALGPKVALLAIALGYLALTGRRAWFTKHVAAAALAALGVGLFAPPLAFVDLPAGGRVLSYREGVLAAVSVVEDANGVASLRINNRQQEGSSATFYVDARQAWLPLLLHPAPKNALFLGLGTGVTATAATLDPTLEVDAVELLPEVIAASTYFTRNITDDDVGARRLRVLAADARRYVRVSDRRYDVIVSDNFHPARSGSGSLYTVEHFQAVMRRLAPGGLFCQWLPLHQLDLETLRSIVRSFTAVYARSWALLANNSLQTPVLALIARADDDRIDVAALRRRLSQSALAHSARSGQSLGLEDELAVLGGFVAGQRALEQFAGSAQANTDDRPVVAYSAPSVTYAPDSSPQRRLSALLGQLSIQPDELVLNVPDPDWSRRLAAYWGARDQFIESGQDVRPSARVEEMLAQVQEPLLAVLRTSPDFRPAYDPLLAMASALGQSDTARARALLSELNQLQPARVEAAQLLRRISDIETAR